MESQDTIIEQLLEAVESTANFMRGMTLDPSIPGHVKEALSDRIKELDDLVDKYA
jgi:hypothetical protein